MTIPAKLLSTTIFFVVAGYLCLVYVNKVDVYPQIAPESKQNTKTSFDEPQTIHQNIIQTIDGIPVINLGITETRAETIQTVVEQRPDDGSTDLLQNTSRNQPVNWEEASRLELLAPRIFVDKPGELKLSQYRNPCWISNSSIYCLPYFYLAGMPKCGTTDLWFKLNQHPFIANFSKEPHWWTRKRIGGEMHTSKPSNIVPPNKYYTRWYSALKLASKSSGIDKRQLIVGDGSASTLWDNRKWQSVYPHHREGPPHTISEVIARIQPDAKVIVILRNPVDRLYSDYLFFTQNTTKTAQDFHSRVIRSLQYWRNCLKDYQLRTCAYSPFLTKLCCVEKSIVRLHVGMYSIYMRDWLKVFHRDQLLVLRLDDWRDDCPGTLNSIYSFLSLGTLTQGQLYHICNQEPLNKRSSDKDIFGPMLNETRQILYQFYDPFNNELADLLRSDAYLWR